MRRFTNEQSFLPTRPDDQLTIGTSKTEEVLGAWRFDGTATGQGPKRGDRANGFGLLPSQEEGAGSAGAVRRRLRGGMRRQRRLQGAGAGAGGVGGEAKQGREVRRGQMAHDDLLKHAAPLTARR